MADFRVGDIVKMEESTLDVSDSCPKMFTVYHPGFYAVDGVLGDKVRLMDPDSRDTFIVSTGVIRKVA